MSTGSQNETSMESKSMRALKFSWDAINVTLEQKMRLLIEIALNTLSSGSES